MRSSPDADDLIARLTRINALLEELERESAEGAHHQEVFLRLQNEMRAALLAAKHDGSCPACRSRETIQTAKSATHETRYCVDCGHIWDRTLPAAHS
jgi:hypothetical protein